MYFIKVRLLLCISFLLISYFSIAQNKKGYWKHLVTYDSLSQANLIGFHYDYLSLHKQVNFRSDGGNINLRLNLAKFFTDKIIVGLYFDFKLFTWDKDPNFSTEFINDFNSSFIDSYTSSDDSLSSSSFKDALNNTNNYLFSGNNYGNYGLVVSPFPLKYGGVKLILSKGSKEFDFQAKDEKKNIKKLFLRNSLFAELNMTPYLFFKKGKLNQKVPRFKDLYKQITFSLYYERVSLNNASIENLPLSRAVSKNFISKYDNQEHFGFKIGISLY